MLLHRKNDSLDASSSSLMRWTVGAPVKRRSLAANSFAVSSRWAEATR